MNDYNKAIQIDSNYTVAYINRGNLFLAQQKVDLALKDYEKALLIDPLSVDTKTNRALLYIQLGNKQLACEDLNSILEIDSKNKEVSALISKHCY